MELGYNHLFLVLISEVKLALFLIMLLVVCYKVWRINFLIKLKAKAHLSTLLLNFSMSVVFSQQKIYISLVQGMYDLDLS